MDYLSSCVHFIGKLPTEVFFEEIILDEGKIVKYFEHQLAKPEQMITFKLASLLHGL